MVTTRAPKQKLSSLQIRKGKHKRVSIFLAAVAGAASVVAHASPYADKERIHTSILTGQRWLQELLEGKGYIISSLIYKSVSLRQAIPLVFADSLEWSDLCSVNFFVTLNGDVAYGIPSMCKLKSNLQSSFALPGLVWGIRRCKNASKEVEIQSQSKYCAFRRCITHEQHKT
jgi:hypothetical protein